MPTNDVAFDAWAWWEIFGNTLRGRRLARKYLPPRGRVRSSVGTMAEIAAKFWAGGQGQRVSRALAHMESAGPIEPLTRQIAEDAGALRAALRKRDPRASLLDAITLATARRAGVMLISEDEAFGGLGDVRAH